MALFDIFKRDKKKKVEEKLKRPPKGALKSSSAAAKQKTEELQKEKEGGAKEGKSEFASGVVLAPHITEKSANCSENGVYVFRVAPAANKIMIKRAIKELYGFTPLRIRTIKMPAKLRLVRGKTGVKPGYKKAAVYLKEGDKIDLS